jgi:hypothetical protein
VSVLHMWETKFHTHIHNKKQDHSLLYFNLHIFL